MKVNIKAEKARIGDVASIQQLVNYFADKGEMLPRALSEIYENIRDYFVVRDRNQIIGCTALHVNWSDLAEIKSLAVNEKSQNQGIGSSLVRACLNEAKELAMPTIFCLTRRPAFFEKHGFHLIDKAELPHKVWAECYRCPKFPNCDEVALIRHI
jgi:amino-acid N-acetyltransferase